MFNSSWTSTYQAEIDYRRDRIRAGVGTRPSRRRLRHRTPRNAGAQDGSNR